MRKLSWILVLVTLVFFALASCSDDSEEDLQPQNDEQNDDDSDDDDDDSDDDDSDDDDDDDDSDNGDDNGNGDDELTYNNGIATIFNNNCMGSSCHGSNAPNPPLTNYQEVKVYVDNGGIEQRVVVQENMPPDGSLSDANRQKIADWLSAGAPE